MSTPLHSPVDPALGARIEPRSAVVGSWLTLTLTLTPTRPLGPGCRLRVQLPRSWHVWLRNSAKGVHSTDPSAPNYVTAEAADAGLELAFEIEDGVADEFSRVNTRHGIDGRQHRYNYVARLEVVRGLWRAGVPCHIIFGDRRQGSAGFSAALHPEGPEPVLVAVDESGGGTFELLPDSALPRLEALADEAVELSAFVPSVASVGETVELRVVALDRFHNAARRPAEVIVRAASGEARVGPAATAPGVDSGSWSAPVKASGPGVVRLAVRCGDLEIVSNPMVVQPAEPGQKIYWGDLHVHSDESYDGTGGHPFEYGREVAMLDYMALTNHSEGYADTTWAETRRRNAAHQDAGKFVTIAAYEATFNGPYGHHNVYFASDDGPVIGNDRGTLLGVWAALQAGQAMTIPHHTAITWHGNPKLPIERRQPLVDWAIHDAEFRRLVEIYSSHGQCETHDPAHPLAYENIHDFSVARSSEGPHWAQDGWLAGHHLGVVCASDDHAGQAGRGHTGLTAVLARDLTRPAIFDALRRRATYGTTGARIVLDFRLGDARMGERLNLAGSAAGSIRVAGTDEISWVELLRADIGRRELGVLLRWEPASSDFDQQWTDLAPPPNGFYYCRLQQRRPVHGRAVMAWSSPIWVGSEPGSPPQGQE